MNDLISRHIIKEQMFKYGFTAPDMTVTEFVEDCLPSAQPERLTDDDFETIRIHLNACKEKLCNQSRWEEAYEYQRIIDRFLAFASAQPEPKTSDSGSIDSEKPEIKTDRTTDGLISRAAVIDAVKEFQHGAAEWREEQEADSNIWHRADSAIASAIEIGLRIKAIPSAQPEPQKGYWIEHKRAEETHDALVSNYECSECHDWHPEAYAFCPTCGIPMKRFNRGEANE